MEYFSSLKPRLIYVFRIPDAAHSDCVKIGVTTFDGPELAPNPNSSILNKAARERIDQYTKTAGIAYELLHTEIALFFRDGHYCGVDDKEIHEILLRSGIKHKVFDKVTGANEWFCCDLNTAKNAIRAAKEGRKALHTGEISEAQKPIEFRPEQEDAITRTLKQFRKGNQMLWNAKMRFGKTLSALEVVKRRGDFRRVLILTHRPVVDDGWYEDFQKIFFDTPDFAYGSKNRGDSYVSLESRAKKEECRYVYFASMQDLRGSEQVGGKFDKNNDIFSTPWDLIIVDEAHEGTQTELGRNVMKELTKDSTKVLRLSGTPFNLLDDFREEEIYTWDYVMEQRAKAQWEIDHPGDHNPYAGLPRLNIYTYDLGRLMNDYADEDVAFNFREFFRTGPDGEFIHRSHVENFLNLLTKTDEESMYPFANNRYRDIFRHTLWMLPGVKAAKALAAMLRQHPVFSMFEVVNVAGDGDEEERYEEALAKVNKAIGDDPDKSRTITLSCGRLTTGVSVKPWMGVFMLSGSFNTAASAYMQTIFRVQTPATINGRVKEDCYVFDFAPDRTLKVLAETAKVSTKAGKAGESDRQKLGEFLNFCPIISIEGSRMKTLNTEHMLQQLKKVYVERVVSNGFEDGYLYNDELLKLSDVDIQEFNDLKGIIGQTKAMAKSNDITVNDQGLTNEEYAEKEKLEKKAKRELTEEDKARLEELKKKRKLKEDAISILRGISIRMPLLIYGAKIENEDEELTIDNFTSLVDPQSWDEFMPKGVSKQRFNAFKKYYDPDIFTAAAKRIRAMARAADRLSVEERIERIASIFATFRNPDKETVLTPWRVVNMHMSDCLGGYTFFNEDFSESIEEPRYVERDNVTADVFSPDSHLLEINSKSGLYPLYLAYNIYRSRLRNEMFSPETLEEHQAIWDAAVAENIFVICKTPMAKVITRRTLLGFRPGKTNMWAPDDLINKIKNQPDLFIQKVHNLVGKDVKIKAIVGNPPYQVNVGTVKDNYGVLIFGDFVSVAKEMKPSYISMITPSRWFAGGRGLDGFRQQMLQDKHLVYIHDFADSRLIFPSVDISGGINYFLWNREISSDCEFITETSTDISKSRIDLSKKDILSRHIKGDGIVAKLGVNEKNALSQFVSAQTPFGLITTYRGKKEPFDGALVLHTSRGVEYVSESDLTSNVGIVPNYKVSISNATAEHAGTPDKSGKYKILSNLRVLQPFEVCTQSYRIVHSFDNIFEAEACSKYISTQFVRLLMLITLASQHISKDTFRFVPMQDFTEGSDIDWSQSVADIDRQLYEKYHLDDKEIAFIESMIKPM